MVTSLTDSKRQAVAEKLAEMRALQNLLISNEQKFIQECNDDEIRDRFRHMLEDDQKNLGVLETAITQYGIQAKPSEVSHKMLQEISDVIRQARVDENGDRKW